MFELLYKRYLRKCIASRFIKNEILYYSQIIIEIVTSHYRAKEQFISFQIDKISNCDEKQTTCLKYQNHVLCCIFNKSGAVFNVFDPKRFHDSLCLCFHFTIRYQNSQFKNS